MRISARNVFKGKVVRIVEGAVNSEVTIQTKSGEEIVSIITRESVINLGLVVGKDVFAVVKASNVLVAVD